MVNLNKLVRFCEESTFRLAEINHLCTSLCPVRSTRLFALISLISILEIKGLKYLFSDQKIDKYWRFYSNYSFDFVTVLEESTEKSQVISICWDKSLVHFIAPCSIDVSVCFDIANLCWQILKSQANYKSRQQSDISMPFQDIKMSSICFTERKKSH